MWYGLKTGLTRREALSIPFAQLLNLIAIEQIKNEGAERKLTAAEEENEFMKLLAYK